MARWFTADWHLGHGNIMWYCQRPFNDVEMMNEAIVDNCRSVLRPEDHLYILGDVSLKKVDYVRHYLEFIPGVKHIIPGNHDYWIRGHMKNPIKDTIIHLPLMKLKTSEARLILCHYPLLRWHHCHRGSIHLYGHEHGSLQILNGKSLDVGVDCWSYFPVCLEDILRTVASYPILGHHGNVDTTAEIEPGNLE